MKHLIIGAGNMISALLPSYIEASGHEFSIYTPSKERAKKFSEVHEIEFLETLDADLMVFDAVWLGMKPQNVEDVSNTIKDKIKPNTTIFSILAGVSFSTLKELYNSENIVRIMPNTPVSVGVGVNLIAKTESLGDYFFQRFLKDFEKSGKNYVFSSEEKIDEITPFSGSGPAYFFEICRIYVEKMKDFGVNEAMAKEVMALTMKGASELILNSSENLETLRNNVTSKKGVTYEALEELKDGNLDQIISKSIDRAYNRVIELKESN